MQSRSNYSNLAYLTGTNLPKCEQTRMQLAESLYFSEELRVSESTGEDTFVPVLP